MAETILSHERLQECPRVTVVRIRGDVMATINGREVERDFDIVLEAEKPRHVLLDLSGVAYGDSSFFSSLLFWREELTKRKGNLVLFALRPELMSTMRVLALDRLLTPKPDQASALASLPNP
jgi:anti-anti-sigma factor